MRIMSLDYGDAKIGIAMTDPLCIIANGIESYKRQGEKKDIEYIATMIENPIHRCVTDLKYLCSIISSYKGSIKEKSSFLQSLPYIGEGEAIAMESTEASLLCSFG